MPHIWNNILVVTADELVPAWYRSIGTLQKNIFRYKGKEYGIKQVCKGGNGRQMLVAYDSLSAEIRAGLGDPRKLDHLLERFFEVDTQAVAFYTKHYQLEDGGALSQAHQEEYIANASVLRACIALRRERQRLIHSIGGKGKNVSSSIAADAQSFRETLWVKHNLKHTLPGSDKRFKEVLKAFETGCEYAGKQWAYNYPTLVSGKLRNQNTRKVTGDVMQLLNNLFAGQRYKPSRTEVMKVYNGFLKGLIECVNSETGELYDPKEYSNLSESTIIGYLGSWSEAIGTEAKRSGNRIALMGKYKPYHSLERPVDAGSIISVDDRQPPFEYATGQRPWLYMGIDLASGAWTVWVNGKSKEGIITEFYRQMVRNYTEWGVALPRELECEASLNSGFTSTFLQVGRMFEHVRIEANNPRGKQVERHFGSLRYEYEKDIEGWIPRPFAKREQNQAGPGKRIIKPYEQIISEVMSKVEDWNNAPHATEKGISKWDYFMQRQDPNQRPTNWRAILPYLGYTTKTKVWENGIIHLNNAEFLLGDDGKVYTGQRLIDAMCIAGGRDVTCVWLDDNDGKVMKAYVMMDDRIICEAVAKPKYQRSEVEKTDKDYDARTVMSAYVATIDAYMREKKNSITELVVIDNTPKPERKFRIGGLNRYVPTDTEAEDMGTMPETETDHYIPNTTSYSTKSLKDRI